MKKIFTIINLVLIFFIVDFSISSFYKYVAEKLYIGEDYKSVDTRPQIVEKKNFQNQSHYNTIARRDLFETKKIDKPGIKQDVKPVKPVPEKIKETALKLDLKGTVTGTGSDPFAVIKKKGKKKEMLYRTGDAVDRAVIKAILREQVILLVDGRQEILFMKKNKASKGSRVVRQRGADPAAKGVEDGFVENITLTWDDIKTLSSDLKNLMAKVRIRPHYYKSQMDGLRITGIKKDSVFYRKLGMKNGDIMTAVNGQQIRTINDITNFYNGFKQLDGSVVTDVEVKRHGRAGKIRYSIE